MNSTPINKLKNFTFLLLIFAVLSFIAYYNRDNYFAAYKNLRVIVGIDGPCIRPIEYSIGTFDKEFGITKEQFINITNEAIGLWDSAVNKELFTYKDTGGLKINLIYDNRQKATIDMQKIGSNIDGTKDSYNSVKAEYNALQNEYNQVKANFESLVNSYNNNKKAYEQQISYWNSRGGVTKENYSTLQNQRLNLNLEANNLNKASASLNILVDKLNSTARHLNSLATNINQNVATYNRIGVSTGLEFDEGEYKNDGRNELINIYQYSDRTKLLRVLAHEFGHALGIDHVNDPKAIMYMKNTYSGTKLTNDDINAIKSICKII